MVNKQDNQKLKNILRIVCSILIAILCFQDITWAGIRDKNTYSSQDLTELTSLHRNFKSGKLSFEELVSYLVYLNTKAELYKIDLKRFPHLVQMINIQRVELHTDFDQVGTEGQVLLNALTKIVSKKDLKEMTQKEEDLKNKKITDIEYFTYIEGLSKKAGLSLYACPNFTNYVEYIQLTKDFKEENLFRDIEAVNTTIIGKLMPVQGNN